MWGYFRLRRMHISRTADCRTVNTAKRLGGAGTPVAFARLLITEGASSFFDVCRRIALDSCTRIALLMLLAGVVRPAIAGERDEVFKSVNESTDVQWLAKIASSLTEAATLGPKGGLTAHAKDLRTAAYARLGAIGSAESLAAARQIEADARKLPILPPTVPTRIPAGTSATNHSPLWRESSPRTAPPTPSKPVTVSATMTCSSFRRVRRMTPQAGRAPGSP